MLKRSTVNYGHCLGYALTLLCPHCKRKNSFVPRRKGEEQYPKIKDTSKKTCVVCGKPFLVKPAILKERDIRTK